MEDIALIIYTHTDCSDIWKPCFTRLEMYGRQFVKKYVFINEHVTNIPEDYQQIVYDDSLIFSEKFLQCLIKINETYVVYTHEDFILYDSVNFRKIVEYKNIIENNTDNICQIQLIRCGMPSLNKPGFHFQKLEPYKDYPDLFVLPDNCKQYNGQTTLWNKKKLIEVYKNNVYGNSTKVNKNKKIIDMENPKTHTWMVNNGIRGLFHYDTRAKLRGLAWDSIVYPYISTAVRKGKWDLRQNKATLIQNLLQDFNIDINLRGYIK